VANSAGSRPLHGSPPPQESSITDAAIRTRPPRTPHDASVLHLHVDAHRRRCGRTQVSSTSTAAAVARWRPPPPLRRCHTQGSSTSTPPHAGFINGGRCRHRRLLKNSDPSCGNHQVRYYFASNSLLSSSIPDHIVSINKYHH
jgi:hypothetical protein